jgi:hypothetical protein
VLDHNDIERNRRVSSDRVLVENYFERVCSLWAIMYRTYKWKEKRFDSLSQMCFALTNCHVRSMPLRGEDGKYYESVLARNYSMGQETARNRRITQEQYRARQERRLSYQTSPSSSTR